MAAGRTRPKRRRSMGNRSLGNRFQKNPSMADARAPGGLEQPDVLAPWAGRPNPGAGPLPSPLPPPRGEPLDTIEPWQRSPRPMPRRPVPDQGWQPPDRNGPLQRGLGYGGLFNGIYRQPGGPPPSAPKNPTPPSMAPSMEYPEGVLPGAFDSGSTAEQTARNSWIGSLSPEEGARAMNAMGYWSGGVPQEARPYSGSTPEFLNPGEQWMAQQAGGGFAGLYTGVAGGDPTFTSFAPQQPTRTKPEPRPFYRQPGGRTRPRRGPGRPRY